MLTVIEWATTSWTSRRSAAARRAPPRRASSSCAAASSSIVREQEADQHTHADAERHRGRPHDPREQIGVLQLPSEEDQGQADDRPDRNGDRRDRARLGDHEDPEQERHLGVEVVAQPTPVRAADLHDGEACERDRAQAVGKRGARRQVGEERHDRDAQEEADDRPMGRVAVMVAATAMRDRAHRHRWLEPARYRHAHGRRLVRPRHCREATGRGGRASAGARDPAGTATAVAGS